MNYFYTTGPVCGPAHFGFSRIFYITQPSVSFQDIIFDRLFALLSASPNKARPVGQSTALFSMLRQGLCRKPAHFPVVDPNTVPTGSTHPMKRNYPNRPITRNSPVLLSSKTVVSPDILLGKTHPVKPDSNLPIQRIHGGASTIISKGFLKVNSFLKIIFMRRKRENSQSKFRSSIHFGNSLKLT